MVSASAEDEPGSRRQLLLAVGGGLAAAGALAVGGCSESAPLRVKVRRGATVAPADVGTLNDLLALEHYTIVAYTAGIPLLAHETAKVAQQFLGQELAHANALSDLIKKARGKPIKPSASYDLGHPTGAADVLALVHRLESAQLSAYVSMIPRLSPGKVRSAVAAIYANDAQHVAILRARLGRPPVPSAFATGGE